MFRWRKRRGSLREVRGRVFLQGGGGVRGRRTRGRRGGCPLRDEDGPQAGGKGLFLTCHIDGINLSISSRCKVVKQRLCQGFQPLVVGIDEEEGEGRSQEVQYNNNMKLQHMRN